MNIKSKRLIIKFVAIILTIVFLLSGCAQLPSPTQSTPSETAQSELSQSPASILSQSPPSLSPITPSLQPTTSQNTAEPTPAPATLPTPLTSGQGLDSSMNVELKLSKAPKVGEIADLTYRLKPTGFISKSINKVQLEFERYDPAVYYPLAKGQYDKDRALMLLAKASPDSGYYFVTSHAAQDQPDTIVPEKDVVVSGTTAWEGAPLKVGDQVELVSQVRFPEEGEWVISAITQREDGSSYIGGQITLTVNQDSEAFDWPEDYSNHGYIYAWEHSPVGVYLKADHAPLVGEEMPLEITIQSIEDTAISEVSLFAIKKGKGEIPISDLLFKGEDSWKGSLKKGVPIKFSCSLKFPEEGDWSFEILVRANPESVEHGMAGLAIHVGKEKSRIGWTTNWDAINNAYKHIIEEIEKHEKQAKEKTSQPSSKEVSGPSGYIPIETKQGQNAIILDNISNITGMLLFYNRSAGWSQVRYCIVELWNSDLSSLLASDDTDEFGQFDFDVSQIQVPEYIKLKVFTLGLIHHYGQDMIKVVNNDADPIPYNLITGQIFVPSNGELGYQNVENNLNKNGAMWIKDDLETGYLFGLRNNIDLGTFIAKWKYLWWDQLTGYSRKDSEAPDGRIEIGAKDNMYMENYQDAVLHEMGHNVMNNCFGWYYWPPEEIPPDHHFSDNTHPGFAWI